MQYGKMMIGINDEKIRSSYKGHYLSNTTGRRIKSKNKSDAKVALEVFIKARLSVQQLNDFRAAFRNGIDKDDISGFLRYLFFNACITYTDKFINYFLQNMEFINAVNQKYKVTN
jgi:hypothetical protein